MAFNLTINFNLLHLMFLYFFFLLVVDVFLFVNKDFFSIQAFVVFLFREQSKLFVLVSRVRFIISEIYWTIRDENLYTHFSSRRPTFTWRCLFLHERKKIKILSLEIFVKSFHRGWCWRKLKKGWKWERIIIR